MTSKFPTMYCHRLAPKANRMTGSARFSNFPGSISGVGTRDIGNGKGDSDRDVGIGNLSSSSRQKNILYYFYGDCTLRSGENVSRRNGLRRSLNGILRRNTDRKRERERESVSSIPSQQSSLFRQPPVFSSR